MTVIVAKLYAHYVNSRMFSYRRRNTRKTIPARGAVPREGARRPLPPKERPPTGLRPPGSCATSERHWTAGKKKKKNTDWRVKPAPSQYGGVDGGSGFQTPSNRETGRRLRSFGMRTGAQSPDLAILFNPTITAFHRNTRPTEEKKTTPSSERPRPSRPGGHRRHECQRKSTPLVLRRLTVLSFSGSVTETVLITGCALNILIIQKQTFTFWSNRFRRHAQYVDSNNPHRVAAEERHQSGQTKRPLPPPGALA